MGRSRIVLTGLSPSMAGLRWESENVLRIGRQNNVDVVLRDFSIDRLQAEVRFTGGRWVLRDLARNPAFPTLLNRELPERKIELALLPLLGDTLERRKQIEDLKLIGEKLGVGGEEPSHRAARALLAFVRDAS